MSAINLQAIIHRLSQGSIDSVQNGDSLGDLSTYLHVIRPIEDQLKNKMQEIDIAGGGIILLIGSAGDGKSHLISCIKHKIPDTDFCFYNDATASSSPSKTAIQTLQEALIDFNDHNLYNTHKKLVLAINLGKLNAFIDEEDVKSEFKEIVNVTNPIFNDGNFISPIEKERVKVVLFTNHQIFEFDEEDTSDYPVSSFFLSSILDKIVAPKDTNPFYEAYKLDKQIILNNEDPLLINYELLCLKDVRDTIVKYIIEAIIRFKLIITPREYLDFISTILLYPRKDGYEEKKDFYEALLPSLIFCGGDNPIQNAMSNLDPLKTSSTIHDNDLSILFTSYSIPQKYLTKEIISQMPQYMIIRTNKFYANNGRDIEKTTKFLFRLKHLLSYDSENYIYKMFLELIRGVFLEDTVKMQEIYKFISIAIPRHNGSYYGKSNMIPLNIQGGKYKLFSKLTMQPQKIKAIRKQGSKNEFLLTCILSWKCDGKVVSLPVNYQLFEYIVKLNQGRLAISYENDKDICFSRFIRELISLCDSMEEITIITSDKCELLLSESLGSVLLQS